jgi:subtilisin family serine protease
MSKGRRLVFILILFGIIVSLQFLNSENQNNRVDKAVFDKISQEETARVIVKFKDSDIGKDNVKDYLRDKVKHDFEDGISAIVSEKELSMLEKNPNVESVKLVGTRQIFLQDSVPLVNATPAWDLQMNSINLTGLGETVCVLDTGTNFDHPDLQNKNLTCVIDCVSGSCAENCSIGDDHGHGTHVSGIVAANGSLKGVIPDANLISVKVCDASGSCGNEDIRAGIDWCVANEETYNISVISMSLGAPCKYDNGTLTGWCYNDYCNNEEETTSINNAISNNISVVIATGNDDNLTHISPPSCIQNATRVGSSTKIDGISSFSNRWALDMLVAPGSSINSTVPTGSCLLCDSTGYLVLQGTSMATPAVAGAFALISQFKRLEGKSITPQDIQTAFNNTGKQINDAGGSNLNYSRIDVYSAVLSLDETAPLVTLISPENNTIQVPSNQTFNCSATDELQLSNLTLLVWNSTSLYYENTTNETNSDNFLNISFTLNLTLGEYSWNCLGYDNQTNNDYATANFTISIAEEISVALNSPENNTYTNISNTNFSCSQTTPFELVNSTFKL